MCHSTATCDKIAGPVIENLYVIDIFSLSSKAACNKFVGNELTSRIEVSSGPGVFVMG